MATKKDKNIERMVIWKVYVRPSLLKKVNKKRVKDDLKWYQLLSKLFERYLDE